LVRIVAARLVVKRRSTPKVGARLHQEMSRPSKAIRASVALCLLVVLAFAVSACGGGKTVPNVLGQEFPAAHKILNLAGFKTMPIKVASNRPAGVVASTDPGPGDAPSNDRLKVRISLGPKAGEVPDTTDLEGGIAADTLKASGFRVQTVNITSALVPAGRVVRSSPPTGARVGKNGFIVLLVSGGARTTAIPDLTGQPISAAKESLQLARLDVLVLPAPGIGKPGRVGAQSPSPGQVAAVGTTVKLWVDAPAQAVTVPKVTGYTGGSASARVGGLQLEPRFISRRARNASEIGLVLAQSPPAGSSVLQGSQMTIVVGTPPQQKQQKKAPEIASSFGLRPGRTEGFSIVYSLGKCPSGRGAATIVPTLGVPYKQDSATVINQGPVAIGGDEVAQIAVVRTTDSFLLGSAEVAIRVTPCPKSGSY
jgi:serine/threonine-protein kinase